MIYSRMASLPSAALKGDLVAQSRRFTFTMHDEGYLPQLLELGNGCEMVFLAGQKEEAPLTGKVHFQGYFELNKKKAGLPILKYLKKSGGPVFSYLTASRGSQAQNMAYVSKDASALPDSQVRLGTPIDEEEKVDVWVRLRDEATAGKFKTYPDMVRAYPEMTSRYSGGTRQLFEACRPQYKVDLVKEYGGLLPWQQQLLEITLKPPDKRSIIWIYSRNGNVGKSEMAGYLEGFHGFYSMEDGDTRDLAFAWSGEHVVFNYPKATKYDKLNYRILESFKDGSVFSSKYVSARKRYERPHVVVFANEPPNCGEMTPDRWDKHVYEIESVDMPMVQIDYAVLRKGSEPTQYAKGFKRPRSP